MESSVMGSLSLMSETVSSHLAIQTMFVFHVSLVTSQAGKAYLFHVHTECKNYCITKASTNISNEIKHCQIGNVLQSWGSFGTVPHKLVHETVRLNIKLQWRNKNVVDTRNTVQLPRQSEELNRARQREVMGVKNKMVIGTIKISVLGPHINT